MFGMYSRLNLNLRHLKPLSVFFTLLAFLVFSPLPHAFGQDFTIAKNSYRDQTNWDASTNGFNLESAPTGSYLSRRLYIEFTPRFTGELLQLKFPVWFVRASTGGPNNNPNGSSAYQLGVTLYDSYQAVLDNPEADFTSPFGARLELDQHQLNQAWQNNPITQIDNTSVFENRWDLSHLDWHVNADQTYYLSIYVHTQYADTESLPVLFYVENESGVIRPGEDRWFLDALTGQNAELLPTYVGNPIGSQQVAVELSNRSTETFYHTQEFTHKKGVHVSGNIESLSESDSDELHYRSKGTVSVKTDVNARTTPQVSVEFKTTVPLDPDPAFLRFYTDHRADRLGIKRDYYLYNYQSGKYVYVTSHSGSYGDHFIMDIPVNSLFRDLNTGEMKIQIRWTDTVGYKTPWHVYIDEAIWSSTI